MGQVVSIASWPGEAIMIRQLKAFNAARLHLAGNMEFAAAIQESHRVALSPVDAGRGHATRFPPRPDGTMISEAIPLYYIAQNQNGLWLAREASGRNGGLFFLKRSAVRFGRKKSGSASCATMCLSEMFELDVPNEGGRLAGLFDLAINAVAQRVPALADFIREVAAEWRQLIADISRVRASQRRSRDAIERDLFRGQYTLASKNDDDLPIP